MIRYLFAAWLWLGGASSAESISTRAARPTLRLLALGDSLTAGVGDRTNFGGYRGPLYRALSADGFDVRMTGSQSIGSFEQPACEGHPGWVIDQIRDGVAAGWIEAARPDAILLMIGTNDLFDRPEGAVARLAKLVDELFVRAPHARLFVATLPPAGEKRIASRIGPYNLGLTRLVGELRATSRPIALVDLHASVNVSQMRDKVHPNANAYRVMAERWRQALRDEFAP